MARPERFQMPLLVEFGGRPADDPIAVCNAIFDSLATDQPDVNRFVRMVREEVFVRSPDDAANHLLRKIHTPFDQFDQEELWTLLLNTKNRVTHEVLVYRGTLNMVQIRLAEVFVNLHTQLVLPQFDIAGELRWSSNSCQNRQKF